MSSPHSEFIATTRAMAQVTNLSPNQIRTNLRRFIADQTEAQKKAAATPEGTIPVSNDLPPAPGDGGMSFVPRPFTPVIPASTTTNNTEGTTPGTSATPYVMGTNSTSGGGAVADNDSWTLAGGPSPSGGGPYDSVAITAWTRIWELGTGSGFIIFTRGVVADSVGNVVRVSVESGQHITAI